MVIKKLRWWVAPAQKCEWLRNSTQKEINKFPQHLFFPPANTQSSRMIISSSDIPADARLQTSVCLIRRGAEGKRKSLRDLRCFRCSLDTARVVLLCSGLKPQRWAGNEASSLICQLMTELTKGLRPQISGLHLIKHLEKRSPVRNLRMTCWKWYLQTSLYWANWCVLPSERAREQASRGHH